VNHGNLPGGLWDADNYEQQLSMYHKIMAEYLVCMTKNNIPTIFIDFDQMIQSSNYLYMTLKPILNDYHYNQFVAAYNFSTRHQTQKSKRKT
jgi:hypothetical protein